MGPESREFGSFGSVSSLTLGRRNWPGWGSTTREEAIATVKMALDEGINHFDLAPMYGRGEAESNRPCFFRGGTLGHQIYNKVLASNVPPTEVYDSLNRS